MRKNYGLTLVELLIVMAVITIIIGIAIPSFRGMQDEARKVKAQGDLKVLKVAIESYYKNNGNQYPDRTNYQSLLRAALPMMVDRDLYDPFGSTSTTQYVYELSNDDPATSHYYVLYSVGPAGGGQAIVDNNGTVTATGDAIWASNGHVQ